MQALDELNPAPFKRPLQCIHVTVEPCQCTLGTNEKCRSKAPDSEAGFVPLAIQCRSGSRMTHPLINRVLTWNADWKDEPSAWC